MKKICFLAQFPPPVHGLSKAVDTLYNSKLAEEFELSKVDITNNNRIIRNVFNVIFSNSEVFYITIAQSKYGNIRDILFMLIILLKRKKIVIHLHGGYFRELFEKSFGRIQSLLNKYVLKRVAIAIVLGESLKYIFKDLVDKDKIRIVENCVDDVFLIKDEDFEKKMLYEGKELKVLYLSNFIKEKGYKEVLDLSLKTKNNKDIKYLFAGKFFDEEDKKRFNDFIESNCIDETVKYYGVVLGKEKLELLRDSDVFILPTFYPKEGQPISIIEAMGNGCYVISTKHAGIPDLIDDGINGILFGVDSIVDKMYSTVDELYNDRNRVKVVAKNNHKKVINSFTEDKYIQKIIRIFNEV